MGYVFWKTAGYVLLAWLVISPILVSVYVLLPKKHQDKFKRWRFGFGIAAISSIGCFMSCLLVVSGGLEKWLIFIPEHWKTIQADGDVTIYRREIAYLVAFLGTAALFCVFDKLGKAKDELEVCKGVQKLLIRTSGKLDEQKKFLEDALRQAKMNHSMGEYIHSRQCEIIDDLLRGVEFEMTGRIPLRKPPSPTNTEA
jgi:hypothetical protein